MIAFDSPEYWLTHIWDRSAVLQTATPLVATELVAQEQLTVSTVREAHAEKGALTILDLGAGTGSVSKAILDTGLDCITLVLLDINSTCLHRAKERLSSYPNTSFVLGNAYDVDKVLSQRFDIIVCLDLLHHLSDLDLVFHIIKNSLDPAGVLIANAMSKAQYTQWDRAKYGRVRSAIRSASYYLSSAIYPVLPAAARSFVRQRGLARVCPLEEQELTAPLRRWFVPAKFKRSYYYWFAARPRRDD